MRVVLQRVSEASVTIENNVKSSIKSGLLLLVGIEDEDHQEEIEWLCRKIINMRIFSDEDDKMNLSLKDIDGEALIISQFTLHASTKKGNRPSFIKAAEPNIAKKSYDQFCTKLKDVNIPVQTGCFGAMMEVGLINDGPVTIVLDSQSR